MWLPGLSPICLAKKKIIKSAKVQESLFISLQMWNMATSIDNLPNEILEIIFRGLSLKDIGHCSQTCVRWEQILASLYKNKGSKWKLIYFLNIA